MTPNNNLSVLPFYEGVQYQDYKKSYAYGDVYPLFTPINNLLPFQIIRPTRSNQIAWVRLYNYKMTKRIADITQPMKETGLQIVRYQSYGYDVILYPGNLLMALNVATEGRYMIAINDGVQTYYSDVFTWVNGMDGYLCIEWSDAENMEVDGGQIVYDVAQFKNRVYVCAELGKPEYKFEEEGEERDGYFFPEKQISEKTFRFIFLAPEYLCDVMRLIRMSDFVTVYSQGRKYDCDTFLITPKWQTQGNLASVECEFECATVVKKIGRGVIPTTGGDYNKDFNNDFNNNDVI
jgi:hypothetical protein|nr:MAG: hypothetical protein [Bacteriophage sp.]